MAETSDRVCFGCGDTEQDSRLETCAICHRVFCVDCGHLAGFGRRFCSSDCTRAYYFAGESDDDEDHEE